MVRKKLDQAERITENLMRCAELTELCLELRCAVLKQSYPEQEARRMVKREILEAKERRWR